MGQSAPTRLPLIVMPENRNASVNKDARLVNGYIEKTGEDVWVVKRPGLLAYSAAPAATGRGLMYWSGSVYSIWGGTLYKDNVAVAGTLDTSNGVYTFDKCLGATPKLFMQNGVKGYTYDPTNGLVNITDPDYPASLCKGSAYLDGTIYVITPTANIQGSNINDPLSWVATNSIIAQIEPDKAVCLAKQLVYVAAFKEFSVEMFYDAGNATGSPLASVQGTKLSVGCRSADSVREIEGKIFWVSQTDKGGPGVYLMESAQAKPIDTPAIAKILQESDLSSLYAWTAKFSKHTFYVLTIVNANITLAYDVEMDLWTQWADTNGNYLPIVASAVTPQGLTIVQHATNGKVYTLDINTYADDGSRIVFDLYTPNFDGGVTQRKHISRLNIVADQVTGSTLSIRCSDDDYQTWTNFRTADLGERQPVLMNCGTFIRRAYHLRHTANAPLRLRALDATIQLGSL